MKRKITTNTAIRDGLAIQARLQAVNRSIRNIPRALAHTRAGLDRKVSWLHVAALQNERRELIERLNTLYN